jgi:hypothetical protein
MGCSSFVGVLVEFSSQYSPFRKLWAHTHLPIKPNYKHGFIEMITGRYHANTPESLARKPIRKNDGQIKGFKYHEQQFYCILIILLDVYCSVGQVYGLALNPH